MNDKSIQPFLDMSGYEQKTTFWSDFSIADKFGLSAVQDTFNKSIEQWKDNYIYLTELVLVLNWKLWQHHEHNEQLARLYESLWGQADEYALKNLKDNELEYFIQTTD